MKQNVKEREREENKTTVFNSPPYQPDMQGLSVIKCPYMVESVLYNDLCVHSPMLKEEISFDKTYDCFIFSGWPR